MKLAAIQAALLAAATGSGRPDRALLRTVRAARCVPAERRITAYRTNIKAAHLKTLDKAYPVTREVLGPRYWRQLLEGELPEFGSRSPDLNRYGEFVPSLLARTQNRRPELRELPYLGELATLEWRVHFARIASDDTGFDWEDFADLPDEVQASSRLKLSNTLSVLRLEYPVDQIWRTHAGADTGANEGTAAIACCVCRQGRFDVEVNRLDRGEDALLDALPHTTVGELYGGITAADVLAQRIFGWIQRGWIVGFETG